VVGSCEYIDEPSGSGATELVGLFVGHHLLLRDFGYYGIIFMTVCVYCFIFSRHLSWAILATSSRMSSTFQSVYLSVAYPGTAKPVDYDTLSASLKRNVRGQGPAVERTWCSLGNRSATELHGNYKT
jgi:hypothetical protein